MSGICSAGPGLATLAGRARLASACRGLPAGGHEFASVAVDLLARERVSRELPIGEPAGAPDLS